MALIGIALVLLLVILIPLAGHLIRKISFCRQVRGAAKSRPLDEQTAAAIADKDSRKQDPTPYIDAATQSNIHHHFP